MTPSEERDYLLDLLFSAMQWRMDKDDNRSPVEVEIRQRLDTLCGKEPVVVDGREQSSAHPDEDDDGEEDHPRGDKWRGWVEGRKRAWIDGGKRVWLPEEQTVLIDIDHGKKKRVAKDSQEYRDFVEKQKDQMWEAHNAENS